MYALQLSAFGEPSESVELVNISEPKAPAADEVLIAVEYSPINPANLLVIRGWYATLPALPAVLGTEGVGRILEIGYGVKNLKVGDRVLATYPSSAWSEKIIVSSKGLFVLPENADPQQLAMLGVNPLTASLLLSNYVKLAPDDWIIQNAGNSGAGRSVIAFAKDRGQ